MLRGRLLAGAVAVALTLGGVGVLIATPVTAPPAAGDPAHAGHNGHSAASPLADADIPWELFKAARCHCGCGDVLKGNPNGTPCFGCSVSRSEHAFIQESLASGRDAKKVLIDLYQLTLVEVFADYIDPGVGEIWARARGEADKLGQHRVVFRSPARTPVAWRALEVVECGRTLGRFSAVQTAFIEHEGPWDDTTLFLLATGAGVGSNMLQECMRRIDIKPQVAKDREHVVTRDLRQWPAIAVNRKTVPDDSALIRAAIRAELMKEAF